MPGRIPTYRSARLAAEKKEGGRSYERQRWRREDKAFYKSPAWISLRLRVLAEEPLCGDCRAAGRLVPSEHVHHVIDRKDRPDLALDRANLEALCASCHNRRRREDR